MNWILVGIGGACGAVTRYGLGTLLAAKLNKTFPWAILLINVSGAFLLGMVVSAELSGGWILLVADGFLGAYTTFSTFMVEGFELFAGRRIINAILYVSGTVLFGLLAFVGGVALFH